MDAVLSLRKAIQAKKPVQLVISTDSGETTATDSIKEATHVKFGEDGQLYSLDDLTSFYNEKEQQKLRPVIFCWYHDKSSIVDYKNACLENEIPDFKFLVKAELTAWLNGSSDSCKFIKDSSAAANGTATHEKEETSAEVSSKKRKLEDPRMARISEFEVDLLDHNAALRGTKNLSLKNLILDAKRFTSQLKRSKSSRTTAKNTAVTKKQPIIIVSPATTALLSLSNIKEFLEQGRFTEPTLKRPESNVISINRPSEKFVPAAQTIMVVDNVDLFTKPEYWDRVIAIFTTGQAWQFSKFKYSKPEQLFQHYQGFYMGYSGDIIPKQINDWNVSVVTVDRGEKRFRDKMIVKDLWAHLDKILMARNYGA